MSHARIAPDEVVAILFDGQKQYPAAKVTVDFTFVDHLEHDCIEIIGICIPFETRIARAELSENYTAGVAVKAEISAALQRLNLSLSHTVTPTPTPTPASSSALLGASAATTGLYSMTYEERQLLPVIRVLISAKSFYEKILANKKLKDKKNRRAEQTMVINSKMTQNMAAQSLLGGISVCLNPAFKSSENSNTAAIPNTTSTCTSTSTSTSEREREREIKGITGTHTGTGSPYLLKIFLFDIMIEYKDIADMKSTFTSHSPYDKLEKGSRRNVDSLKRRISYSSLDTGPDPGVDNDIGPDPYADLHSDSVHLINKDEDKNNNINNNHDDNNNNDNDDDDDENSIYNGESEKDSKGAFEDYYENVTGSERRDAEDVEEEAIKEVEEEVTKEAEVEVVKEIEEVVEEDIPTGLADEDDATAAVGPVLFVIETEVETVMEIKAEIEKEVC